MGKKTPKIPKCKNCKVNDQRFIRHNYDRDGFFTSTTYNKYCSKECRNGCVTGDAVAFIGKPLNEILQSFNEFPMDYLRPRTFVYVLIKNDYVVYFGSTTNVVERIRVHKNAGIKDFDRAMFFESNSSEALEIFLIKNFPTQYNNCGIAKTAHSDYDDGLPF